MRIVIAAQNYFPPNNGQAVFVRHLAEGLAARGHGVTVMTPSEAGPPSEMRRNGVDVRCIQALPLAPFYPGVSVTVRPLAAVEQILDHLAPDLVHLQDHFPLCRAVSRAAWQRRLPLVGTNHFMPQNIAPFVPVLSRFAWSEAAMERVMWEQVLAVFRRVDIAAAPSRRAAAMLREAGLRRPIRAISNGIDLARFRPVDVDRDRVRVRHGLDPRRFVFGFVGRVDREKRVDVLLQALARLERSDVQVAVAGTGRDRDALIRLADALGLGDRAVFPGFIPADDLVPLLNSLDVFAMPSEAELQSIATLEAMACGRPVLAADACALPELVADGVNGRLFRAGDEADAARAMERLLSDPLDKMGSASRRLAEDHAVERTLDAYEDLYHEVARCRAA